MTRFFSALGMAAFWAGAVLAQPAAEPATQAAQTSLAYDPVTDARERERIAVERETVRRQTGEAEADCYQRFYVSVCLTDVRKQRRLALEALRKQELALNAARRAAATQAQIRKVQERQAQKEEGSPRPGRAPAPGATQAPSSPGGKKPASVPAPERESTANTASDEAQRRERLQREYEERQRLARERQQARDQKLQNSTSKPLPVPP